MKFWTLAGSTAMALVLAQTAAAEVTPEEVWQSWQDIGKAQGQTITADSATRDGDTLTVTNITMKIDQDDVVVTAVIEEAEFTDQGDGTVEVTMSDSFPLTVVVPSGETETPGPTTLELTVSQPGLSVVASGTVAAPSYAYEAPTFGIKLDTVDGVAADAGDVTGDLTMTGLKGTYQLGGAEGGLPVMQSDFTAQALSLILSGEDTEAKSTFRMTASAADLGGSTKGTYMDVAAMEDFAKALQAGFSSNGSFTYGKASFDIDVTEEKGPTRIKAAQDGGSFTFGLNKDSIAYGGSGKAVSMTIEGGEMPVPSLTFGYAEAAFDFLIPIAKSAEPQDFKVLAKLIDLSLSPEIWGMMDPTAQLPHDPATIVIDATGKATVTADIMDEQAMMAMGDAPPAQLNALNLNALQLKLAGAELTGSGAMTFDNSDMTTFPGMPLPSGSAEFKLTGGNALLDKLVAMGLVPQDQVAGIRMMTAMFATAVEGEDTLTSTVKIEDKALFVNGQRMN